MAKVTKSNYDQRIVPFLWFNTNAEEAVNFYVSIFNNSKVQQLTRYGEGAPIPAGTVMTVGFTLEGQEFVALNGGPQFKFTEAVSFFVKCETQEEIDFLWEKLTSDGGQEQPCGWCKDKFGLSWQIVPSILVKLLADKDPGKSMKVMTALMKMKKLDIQTLKKASES